MNSVKTLSTSEESGCDKMDEDVSKEVTLAKKIFTLKKLLEILHNTESIKDEMLEADPNSESSRTICQCLEKMLSSYHKHKLKVLSFFFFTKK